MTKTNIPDKTPVVIPPWVKVGVYVRFKSAGSIARVTAVRPDSFDAVGAFGKAFFVNHLYFNPATLEDRIKYVLVESRAFEPEAIKHVIGQGRSGRDFRIAFGLHLSPDKLDVLREHFEWVELAYDMPDTPTGKAPAVYAVIVTVPMSWLDELVVIDPVTPSLLAQAQDDTDAQQHMQAVLTARILDHLKRGAGCRVKGAVVTKGVSHSEYLITFEKTGDIRDTAAGIKGRCDFIDVARDDRVLTVTIPSKWELDARFAHVTENGKKGEIAEIGESAPAALLTEAAASVALDRDVTHSESVWTTNSVGVSPEVKAKLMDEFDLTEADFIDPPAADAELTEAALLIERLQAENAQLRAENEHLEIKIDAYRDQVDNLITDIEGRDGMIDEQIEHAEVTPAQLVSSVFQGKTLIQELATPETWAAADRERADLLTQGWTQDNITVLHALGSARHNFTRVITLSRFAPLDTAPVPVEARAAARRIEPVGPTVSYIIPPEPALTGTLNQAAPVATFEIPPYQPPPIGMTRDEQIAWRLQEIDADANNYRQAVMGVSS